MILLTALPVSAQPRQKILGGPSLPNTCALQDVFWLTTGSLGMYECIVAGTPGTWQRIHGSGGGLPTGLTYGSHCFTVGTDTDNQAVVCGSLSGSPVTITASGTDTNVGMSLITKGTGQLVIPGIETVGDATFAASAFQFDPASTTPSYTWLLKNPANDNIVVSGGGSTAMSITQDWRDAGTTYSTLNVGVNVGTGAASSTVAQFIFSGSALLTLKPTGLLAIGGDFGGTSPALKGGTSGATLAVRTANDAADAPLSASTGTFSVRTGTPDTFTTFDSGGKLVAGAAYAVSMTINGVPCTLGGSCTIPAPSMMESR